MSIFSSLFQYQIKVDPLQPITDKIESRWHEPWSEPVRTKIAPALAIALAASGLFFTPSAPFPETVTESRWHQPWSEPSVKTKRGLAPSNHPFLAFTPPQIAAVIPTGFWGAWPDFAPKTRPVLNFQPWSFVEPPPQIWFPHAPWDDFTRRKPMPLDTQPQAFVQLAPQVFFPYAPWDDFTRRKPQPLDTQPLIWTGQTIAAPAPVMAWINWPDFAPKKPTPLNYEPLTLVQTVVTPWNVWTQWPDFAPIRGKAGLHAALQQFSIRFPGLITGTTINAIMNAFETNSDGTAFSIYVIQSQPAVSALVSIKELGILGGSITP